jgi:hypothetical protein
MITSSDICEALRKKYIQPEWSIFFEVANGTGSNVRRHADALAMNMYPSRGLTILGFEIKVSHGDLVRELMNPDKAEEIAQYCNEWWLVVSEGVIRETDDIPRPWGVMEFKDGAFKITKKAEPLNPKPVTKSFMAAVIRSAGKIDENTIRKAREEAYRKAMEAAELNFENRRDHATKELKMLTEKINEFEKITGKEFNRWTNVEKLAESIKLAEDYQSLVERYGTLNSLRRSAVEFIKKTEFLEEQSSNAV